MIPFGWEIYGVPCASAELEEGLAFGIKYGRFGGSVSINSYPLVRVAGVP